MKKMLFLSLRILLGCIFLTIICFLNSFSGIAENPADSFRNVSIGTVLEFGSYEQDNNPDNGPEPIEWLVLEVRDEKAFLLSKYGLDAVQFNNKALSYANPVKWESCSLREWLNGSFIFSAFSEKEQERIVSSFVDSQEGSPAEGYTKYLEDRIIILSVEEARSLLDEAKLCCEATQYAKSKKLWIGSEGNCWWWLRTPGEQSDYVAHVGTEGDLHIYGNRATAKDGAVRPALWISLEDSPD